MLACPLRRFRQDPTAILRPYIREGMTVFEPGPGMGFFTLDMGRLVGYSGRVVAVDIQPRMLARLQRRAAKAGLAGRIETRLASPGSMQLDDLAGRVDFTLAFAVVHELPSAEIFFSETARAMKTGAKLLLAEPKGHVASARFEEELRLAAGCGLDVSERPAISGSQTALLVKA
jgi:SAM-dependent methyltransferase